jgi:hypothetical protein
MGAIVGLPRLFQVRGSGSVSTTDKLLTRVIIIQEAIAGLHVEEAKFVLETVHRNMELNDELRRVTDGREE